MHIAVVFSQLSMKQIPFALATAEAHALTPTLPSLSPVPRTFLHQPPIMGSEGENETAGVEGVWGRQAGVKGSQLPLERSVCITGV